MISADSYHQCKIIYILITALLPNAVFSIPPWVTTFGNENSNFVHFFRLPQQTDDPGARTPVSTLLWV
jgi:hypothetical protein